MNKNIITGLILVIIASITTYAILKMYVINEYSFVQGYAKNLAAVHRIYDLPNKSDLLERDLKNMDFVQTNENSYERSYGRFKCEIINFDREVLAYMVSDTCFSVIDNEVVRDFDGDGSSEFFFINSHLSFAYLTVVTDEATKTYAYDLNEEQYTTQLNTNVKQVFDKCLSGYDRFINAVNAKVF